MASFWLLLLLSTVNVVLGYALAAYLGYAPPSLRDAWIALGIQRIPENAPDPASSIEVVDPQDRPLEPAPVGLSALEFGLAQNGIEMLNASAEYGGGAT
jgi:hypothetical protein